MDLDVPRIRLELTRALGCLPEQLDSRPDDGRLKAKATAHTRVALLLLTGSQYSRIFGGPKEKP